MYRCRWIVHVQTFNLWLSRVCGDKELLSVWLANPPEIVTDSLAREHQAELLLEQDEKMKAVAKVLQERGIPSRSRTGCLGSGPPDPTTE